MKTILKKMLSKIWRPNRLSAPLCSDFWLDKFDEPEVAYTSRKIMNNQHLCDCVKGAYCYAKGGKKPCDAGLLKQNTALDKSAKD